MQRNDVAEIREAIYDLEKRLARCRGLFLSRPDILDENKSLVLKFISFQSARGVGKNRQLIYVRSFDRFLRGLRKPLCKGTGAATKEHLIDAMRRIEEAGLAEWTKATIKTIIKTYYRWLYGLDSTDPLPTVAKWIKNRSPGNGLQKGDLITEEELARMITTSNTIMVKAMLAVLYESCARPAELLAMRIRDVGFEDDHARVSVTEMKTGKARSAFLFKSYDLLRSWMASHPTREEPGSFLWVYGSRYRDRPTDSPLRLTYLGRIVKSAASRAGIRKRVYPYLFRHSSATENYRIYGEALAKKMMGHSPDSKMARVYNHLSEEDVLDAVALRNGKKRPEKEDASSGVCPKCHHSNSYGSITCLRCAFPLNQKAGIQAQVEKLGRDERLRKLEEFADLVMSIPRVRAVLKDPDVLAQASQICRTNGIKAQDEADPRD